MRRTTIIATVALVAALAAGCGQDPKPTFSPSEAPATPVSPTTDAAPAAGPPEMPAAAKKHTKAGAEAFVRHLVATVNYSNAHLDTSALRKLVNANCDGCMGGIDGIEKIKSRHGRIDGGVWSVEKLRSVVLTVGADFHPILVNMTVRSTPESVSFPGSKARRFGGGSTNSRVVLSPVHIGWLVANWELAK